MIAGVAGILGVILPIVIADKRKPAEVKPDNAHFIGTVLTADKNKPVKEVSVVLQRKGEVVEKQLTDSAGKFTSLFSAAQYGGLITFTASAPGFTPFFRRVPLLAGTREEQFPLEGEKTRE
jgi:hypothetical protein